MNYKVVENSHKKFQFIIGYTLRKNREVDLKKINFSGVHTKKNMEWITGK